MQIDKSSSLPLYKQVKNILIDRMMSDHILVGGKLSSEREIIAELGVSRITVRQALKELVVEGHLQSIPGKGFYRCRPARKSFELNLTKSFTETARAMGKTPGSQLLSCTKINAGTDIATFLNVKIGTELTHLRRMRSINGLPVAICDDWVLTSAAPNLKQLNWRDGNLSLYTELTEKFNLSPTHGETKISACLANDEQAQLLQTKAPIALLCVEQLAFNNEDQLVNGSKSLQLPSAYPLKLQHQ